MPGNPDNHRGSAPAYEDAGTANGVVGGERPAPPLPPAQSRIASMTTSGRAAIVPPPQRSERQGKPGGAPAGGSHKSPTAAWHIAIVLA